MPTYTFTTPMVKEGPIGRGRLFSFFQLRRGVTVLKTNGQYFEYRFPSADILAQVDKYYLGGSEYVVSEQEAAELTAAGYGDNITVS
jgi:hypothetical protein